MESPTEKASFKRPREVETGSAKRRKYNSLQIISENPSRETLPRYKLQRSISETAASSLASVLHQSKQSRQCKTIWSVVYPVWSLTGFLFIFPADLIADFSRPYALPMISGRHEDLKSITSDTLANLLNGNYSSTINSFKIIDCRWVKREFTRTVGQLGLFCRHKAMLDLDGYLFGFIFLRYPYEFEGGHIKGSVNLYTREQVQKELFDNAMQQDENSTETTSSEKRNILVFHCEFSVERGPTL